MRGWKASNFGFPKGKINQQEPERDCAVREVLEETGYDCGPLLEKDSKDFLELFLVGQRVRLYIVPGVDEAYPFETQTRKEISQIKWFPLTALPTWNKKKGENGRFYLISPFVRGLKKWIQTHQDRHPRRPKGHKGGAPEVTSILARESASASPAPAAMPAAAPASSSAAAPVPHFPDPSSIFPTFPTGAPASAPKAAAAASAALDGNKGADVLKSMLGLGASPRVAAAVASKEDHPATPGIGARMIEAQGTTAGGSCSACCRAPSARRPRLRREGA